MTQPSAPAPPYLGPAAHHGAADNKPIERIVIHSTVSACVPGGARKIAAYFRSAAAGGSAHYVVDPLEVVQVVYDSVVAYHAPPNQHSLGIELCDMPTTTSKVRWEGENHAAMLELAAQLTAELCHAYGVPARWRSAAQLSSERAADRAGITTHAEVSAAFKQSSHWDPGAWPRRTFMRKVRKALSELEKGTS